MYSSEQSHDLCYAVSDQPLTGYRYGGILVSNADIGRNGNTTPKAPYGNTHGGLVQLGGQWYIFYHRQTHGIECCRQGCAEPVVLDAEGRFHQAEITSCGLNGGPLPGTGNYNACYACNLTHETIGKERLTIRKCVRDTQPHIFEEPASSGKREDSPALYRQYAGRHTGRVQVLRTGGCFPAHPAPAGQRTGQHGRLSGRGLAPGKPLRSPSPPARTGRRYRAAFLPRQEPSRSSSG